MDGHLVMCQGSTGTGRTEPVSGNGIALGELADRVDGRLEGDREILIFEAASIDRARQGQITLADDTRLAERLRASEASAVVVPTGFGPTTQPQIVVTNVHEAFAKIVACFRPVTATAQPSVSPQSQIAATARVGSATAVGPFSTIGEDVEIGHHCTIHSGVQIASGCRLGNYVTLFPNVVLYENSRVGCRSTIHAGAVIGAYGFGYQVVDGRHQRGAQLGYVEIGEDVEIGAGTTIDRGSYDPTVIGDGTKIDDQVMVGHNCRLGKHNLVCSQAGIAGSCTTGDYVVMAGQVGLADHLTIGDRAVLGAKAGVMNDVPADSVYVGAPATPEREQWRMWGHVRQLPEIRKQIKQLLRRLDRLDREACGPGKPDAA